MHLLFLSVVLLFSVVVHMMILFVVVYLLSLSVVLYLLSLSVVFDLLFVSEEKEIEEKVEEDLL